MKQYQRLFEMESIDLTLADEALGAMDRCERAHRHDQTAVRCAHGRRDGALDVAGVAQVDRVHLHPERRRHRLDGAQLADHGGDGGIAKHRRARDLRRDLLEQLQPFPADAVFEIGETGDVASRPRQTGNEAAADRVDGIDEHDRQGAGRPGRTGMLSA